MELEQLNIDLNGLSISMKDTLNISTALRDRGDLKDSEALLDALKVLIEVREEIAGIQLKRLKKKKEIENSLS